jgi:23S rRNA (guanosine2251-2'-O)-methyltransferase
MSAAPAGGGRGKRSRTPAPKGGARGGAQPTGREAKAAWMKAKDAAGGRGGRGAAPPRGAGRAPVNDRGRGPGGAKGAPVRRGPRQAGLGGDQVEGRQAVRELLSAGRRPVTSLLMAEGMDAAEILDDIEALAARRRVKVDYVSRRRIDAAVRTDGSQGVVALARPIEETALADLCQPTTRGRVPFLLVLDGITDPHNLGAVLRSAECAGVTGVVLPRHRSAHLSPTVAKVAAGAIEYLPMALVAGIPTALDQLAPLGVVTVGLVGEAPTSLYDLPLGDQPVALVLGSEGSGLAALTRRRCDELAAIPQHGTLSSLNVATAGAIACFDVARQRSASAG